jgi:hypothetical protein
MEQTFVFAILCFLNGLIGFYLGYKYVMKNKKQTVYENPEPSTPKPTSNKEQ